DDTAWSHQSDSSGEIVIVDRDFQKTFSDVIINYWIISKRDVGHRKIEIVLWQRRRLEWLNEDCCLRIEIPEHTPAKRIDLDCDTLRPGLPRSRHRAQEMPDTAGGLQKAKLRPPP